MARPTLGDYKSNKTESSSKKNPPKVEEVDSEGNAISEKEIESVMEGKDVSRKNAIDHIKIVRKKAYEKQALAKGASQPDSEKEGVPTQKGGDMKENPSRSRSSINKNGEENMATDKVPAKKMDIIPFEDQEKELVQKLPESLRPVMSLGQLVARRKFMQLAMEKVLVKGKHYGNPRRHGKPVWDRDGLLKPGAESLSSLFGLKPEPLILEEFQDFEKHIYRYRIKVSLISIKTDEIIGSAIAFATSEERGIGGSGAELNNNALQRAQKRAFVKAMEFVTGVDEMFINKKDYAP